MLFQTLQILILMLMPYFLTKLTLRLGTENWLSPVVCCYIVGIGLRNLTNFPLDQKVSSFFSQAAVVVAIPLLLYSTDFPGWLKLAKSTIFSFVLMILCVVTSSTLAGWFFKNDLPAITALSGMLSGVYIGGTPNLNAIGIALEVKEDLIITLNAAEIACGGVYLVFLTSVAPWFYGLFLTDFQGDKHTGADEYLPKNGYTRKDLMQAYSLTLVLIAISIGAVWLLSGSLQKPGLIILLLSALSVAASFVPRIRKLSGTYESGEYLLLIFSIAIGMLADFSEIFSSGGTMIAFATIVLVMAVFFHVVLCRLFGIDRDTMIITSTAAIYGPPFIGQVTAVLKNRSLLFSGIATGLVGIAVANFIGVALANLLEQLF
jgi:uncharacterized membrane protein